jgi:hypothetical protein
MDGQNHDEQMSDGHLWIDVYGRTFMDKVGNATLKATVLQNTHELYSDGRRQHNVKGHNIANCGVTSATIHDGCNS